MPAPDALASLGAWEPAMIGDKRVRVDGVAVDGRIMRRLARPAVGVPPDMVAALGPWCGGDATADHAPRLASGALKARGAGAELTRPSSDMQGR